MPAGSNALSALVGPVAVAGIQPLGGSEGSGYDLTVDQTHTYLVGSAQVLVHNVNCDGAGGGDVGTTTALTKPQAVSLAKALADPNKIQHIFGKAEHNLDGLLESSEEVGKRCSAKRFSRSLVTLRDSSRRLGTLADSISPSKVAW